jgi:threonine dehydratase
VSSDITQQNQSQPGVGVSFAQIEAAKQRIQDVVVETPLIRAHRLSAQLGTPVYLKCENLQVTASFKARGASNFVLSLVEEQQNSGRKVSGVVTASSGNHGQAVAYAAQQVGLPCTVVVPEDVISVKEAAIKAYGASVVRCGVTSSERIDYAEKLSREQDLVFVPPYDHPHIVAGQATVGLEIMEKLPEVTEVFVPVGGGGLISGVSTAVKTFFESGSSAANEGLGSATQQAASAPIQSSSVRVTGVEPEIANDTFLSLQQGQVVDIGPTTTIADGLRTSHPGSYTFPIVKQYVDEIVLVAEDDIIAAMKELFAAKLVVEPSGCTSVAALLQRHRDGHRFAGPVVCVLSGGNVAPETFAGVLD